MSFYVYMFFQSQSLTMSSRCITSRNHNHINNNHNYNDISIRRYMYIFKYREIHRQKYIDKFIRVQILKYISDSVVQVRTFINFLTSEFGSSTRGERDTILKSLSYHTMLTKLKHSSHLVEFSISFHLRWSGPEKLNRMPQRSKPKLFNIMVTTQLLPCRQHGRGQLSNTLLNGRELNSLCPKAETKSSYMAQSQLPTDVFFKIPKFSDPWFRGWHHSQSSHNFLSGIYYDNCDCYTLCART